jgi:hypothetical protein
VCGVHRARGDEKHGFLGSATKPGLTVFSGLASKSVVMVFSVLASKLVATVFSGLPSKPVVMVSPSLASKPVARGSQFGPQNRQLWFGDLGLQITATVSWFGPQNLAGYGFSVAPQNQ